MIGRTIRLAAVAAVGIAVAVAAYIAIQIVTSPGAREARDWDLLATLPNGRGETAVAVADGRLYVLGGYTGLDLHATDEAACYDPARDTWESLPSLPAPRHHAAAASLAGIVYLSGGGSASGDPQRDLWALSPDDGSWASLAPMPQARIAHRMVAVRGLFYVVGGDGGAAVLIYDPGTDTWSEGTDMPEPRNHLAAVAVGDEIWAIGGRAGQGPLTRVDIYDTRADAWRPGPALPRATSAAAEGIIDGVIFVSGGEDPGRDAMVDAHWQLDARLGDAATWVSLTPPPLTVHGATGGVVDGRFFIAGGASRPGSSSRFAWSSLLQEYVPPS